MPKPVASDGSKHACAFLCLQAKSWPACAALHAVAGVRRRLPPPFCGLVGHTPTPSSLSPSGLLPLEVVLEGRCPLIPSGEPLPGPRTPPAGPYIAAARAIRTLVGPLLLHPAIGAVLSDTGAGLASGGCC